MTFSKWLEKYEDDLIEAYADELKTNGWTSFDAFALVCFNSRVEA